MNAIRTMQVEIEVMIGASPETVFDALTAKIGSWWTFTFRSPSSVLLEPWAGGRFLERWEDGGGVHYATVTRVKPGVLLVMDGAMGMSEPVRGEIVLTLVGISGGTQVTLTHRASGEIDEGTEALYRRGWDVLLGGCLKRFAETGAIPPELSNS